jgi:hypothetical protein
MRTFSMSLLLPIVERRGAVELHAAVGKLGGNVAVPGRALEH